MITEEDLAKHAGLKPEQRFYLTERLARERLAEARREADSHSWPAYDDHDYMIEVMAAAEAFGISELRCWELPSLSDDNSQAICRNFRAEATKVSQRLMLRYAGTVHPDPNSVELSPALKEKLRFHLGQVRGIIDKAPLPSWKKECIYDAIEALECELDKARTRLSAIFDVVGKAWDGEVRTTDALRQVITIVQSAREVEQAKLPTPIEPKRIEGPKRTSSTDAREEVSEEFEVAKNVFDQTFDDEIPF